MRLVAGRTRKEHRPKWNRRKSTSVLLDAIAAGVVFYPEDARASFFIPRSNFDTPICVDSAVAWLDGERAGKIRQLLKQLALHLSDPMRRGGVSLA
jgi:hypothetical protein